MSETSTRKVRPIEAAGRRDGDLDGLAARPIATVYADLETRASGLTGREAAARLKRFGENRIDTGSRRHLVAAVIDRLRNPLVLILFAAAGVSAFTGDVPSFVIITVIVRPRRFELVNLQRRAFSTCRWCGGWRYKHRDNPRLRR